MKNSFSISFTSYHLHLLMQISGGNNLIDFSPSSGSIMKARNYLLLIMRVMKYRHSNAEIILPHPFHPVGLLVFLVCRNISLIDDGVALYKNTKLPDTFLFKIYLFILKLRFNADLINFNDILILPNLKKIYVLYPEYLSFKHALRANSLLVEKILIKNIIDDAIDIVSKVLVLDTNKSDYEIYQINVDKVIHEINCLANKSNLSVVVKPHPSKNQSILVEHGFEALMADGGDIIDNIENFNYSIVIGYLSTGLITIKNFYPNSRVISLYHKENQASSDNLFDLFVSNGIEIILID